MSVFKIGDVVYHPLYGESKIINVHDENVLIDNGPASYTNYKMLSFKPWPAPCHERPVEDGVWICYVGEALVIRKRINGDWYVVDKQFKAKATSGYSYDEFIIKRIAD